jgi:amino acid adenylation domain-containing protein
VQVTRRNLAQSVSARLAYYGDRPEVALWLPSIGVDSALAAIFGALCQGGQLVIPPRGAEADTARLSDTIARHGVTQVLSVMSLYSALLTQANLDQLASLRRVIVGGETCPPDLVERHYRALPRAVLHNEYGPTEATIWCSVHRCQPDHGPAAVPIGRPVAGARMYLLDAHQQPVPVGAPGEICVGGAGVARGYLNRAELTAQRFLPDPFAPQPGGRMYRTGDQARQLADGSFVFLGRMDEQAKIRGHRVELGEIEAAVRQHPAVAASAVTVQARERGGARLIAYVTPRPGHWIDIPSLRQHLSQSLPGHMMPAAFITLEALPLSPAGKVDRKALPPPGAPESFAAGSVAPRTPIEAELAGMWAEMLETSRVGAHDDFFELGGHSLLATQIVARIRDVFGVDLPVRQVFDAPTVAQLADMINARLRPDSPVPEAPRGQADRSQPLPLAFSQERMWFIQRMQPASTAYNMPVAVRLTGRLDVAALQRSLETIARRHEALRTTFAVADGRPVQVIAAAATVDVARADLRAAPVTERLAQALRLASSEARLPFDLHAGPLFRVTLAQLAEDDHVLVIVMHHAISDAWSMGVLAREFMALYTQAIAGRAPDLPELPIQCADFAVWQRQWFTGRVLEDQLAYWRRRLDGVPVLELPTDKPRPVVQTYHGAIQALDLPEPLLAALKRIAQSEGASLHMVLLAAFDTLLHRFSGQTDIAVGTPIANRRWHGVENLIGSFVNTLVLRADLSGDPAFIEVARRVRAAALEAYAYQDLPFAQLVAELRPERDTSHAPLIQVMFNVVNVPLPALELPGLKAQYLEVDRRAAQFDLSFTIADAPGIRQAVVEYNTDLFDDATARRLLDCFETLLAAIVEAPDTPISRLPILPPAAQRQVLEEWNDTDAEFPAHLCVHQWIAAQARRTPDAVAAVCGGQRLTYARLEERAEALARRLRRLGVRPDTLVGICLDRSLDMLIGVLGILKSGGAYAPLDPAYPAERLAFMIEDSQMPVLLTSARLADSLPPHRAAIVLLEQLDLGDADPGDAAGPDGEDGDAGVRPDHLAYTLYTSGSTGKPKGVQITHRAAVNFLVSMLREPGLSASDVLLAVTTLSFDIAGLELFLPLVAGARVVIAGRADVVDGRRLAALIDASGATVMQATPATWQMLVDAGWRAPARPLTILCGGEALSRELADKLLDRGAGVWNLYGPTETTIWSTVKRVERCGPITVGRPIANTRVYILDRHLQAVPPGVPGGLYIAGAGLARGYLNRPELTAEKFVRDPYARAPGERMYATGDVARFLADGEIEHLGRSDHQVKVRGFRVELGEIEAALSQHPGVLQAVVIAREDRPGDRRLVAYVIPQPQPVPSPDALRHFLEGRLPAYMLPSAFVSLAEFPLTPNKKVDRRALPAPGELRVDQARARVAPRTELEARLARLWEEVLGIDGVGVTDDFFSLGGHSLLVVRLFARIEEELGKRVPLATIFQDSTIERLARAVDRITAEAWPSLVPIQPRGARPPLFFVHPLGGDVVGYREWSRHLGDDQPFYALRSRGLDGIQEPHDRIENMAADYLREIRAIQPRGPYRLGGYCAGGVVAFEMASQLAEAGQAVEAVIIVNQSPPGAAYYRVTPTRRWLTAFLRNLPHWFEDLAQLPLGEIASRTRGKLATARVVLAGLAGGRVWPNRARAEPARAGGQNEPSLAGAGASSSLEERRLRQARAFARAWDRYAPRAYSGRITVIRTQRQPLFCSFDPALGWSGLAAEVMVMTTPGSNTNLLREPYAREFAERLKECL